jgi:pimeloyl-ACP methyl ester carboxylesterase
VLAFDQVGFGTRQHEGRDFYARYPGWSRLGRMVQDAMAAVDVLVANQSSQAFRPSGSIDRLPSFPCVDPERISLVGYSIGGAVALHAAAADPRVSAVVSVSGFEPLRTSTRSDRSGGNQRFFEWHATQPQLSWFDGDEAAIPYDYDDVLKLVSPRPALIYAPLQDRECDAAAVASLVNASKWDALQLQQPDTYNVMDTAAQAAVTSFIQSSVRASRASTRMWNRVDLI